MTSTRVPLRQLRSLTGQAGLFAPLAQRAFAVTSALALLLVFGKCAPRRSAVPGTEPRPCELIAPPHNAPVESLTVAVSTADNGPLNEVDIHARFAFSQAYETLIAVDCRGQLYSQLAESWQSGMTGSARRWTIVLAEGARFWNGDRVKAADVVAAWQAAGEEVDGVLARQVAAATTIINERTLSVALSDSIIVLAHPSLAVRRERRNSPWAEGTGAYRIHSSSTPERLTLEPVNAGSASSIIVRSVPAAAARDAIDTGVDLVLTGDATVASYAEARGDRATLALPWDRVYVILAPDNGGTATKPSADSRLTLAQRLHAAAPAVTRVAQPPFWWESSRSCALLPAGGGGAASLQGGTRVVYSAGDRVAQGMAERLVALAGDHSAPALDSALAASFPAVARVAGRAVASGLTPNDFAIALQSGRELAYVISLPRAALAPCAQLLQLLRAAPWIPRASADGSLPLTPLIDTRRHIVAKHNRLGIVLDGDVSLQVVPNATRGRVP